MRAVGSDAWRQLGKVTRGRAPQHVGLIAKTWSPPSHVVADFDYLRVVGR
jgi:hypothetical protein